jgi:Spy/CpxP family protein refolding chaperone
MKLLGLKVAAASLAALCGAAGLRGAALAGRTGSGGRALQRLRQTCRQLGITPAQRTSMRDLAIHAFVEQRGLEMENLTLEEKARRLFTLRKEFCSGVERVLTAEQKSKAKSMWESNRSRCEAAVDTWVSRAAEKISATPAQKEQIAGVVAEARKELQALRVEPALDDPTRVARALAVVDTARDRVIDLLTPEQRAQARKLVEDRIKAALPPIPGA